MLLTRAAKAWVIETPSEIIFKAIVESDSTTKFLIPPCPRNSIKFDKSLRRVVPKRDEIPETFLVGTTGCHKPSWTCSWIKMANFSIHKTKTYGDMWSPWRRKLVKNLSIQFHLRERLVAVVQFIIKLIITKLTKNLIQSYHKPSQCLCY